eukprot:CAMPEP_0201570030 /NCGR_PEP_ID=MMETSP0190_2-20130828/12084_1 /ASSEMBLY_ACC=CAM_ASM_000263 /TAXON_ID=37353 /ORGANISM="Rosalina sp." /LENGTH=485 /DNA_ID=CAMNT_0047993111 /DNA_START=32 /DNA_END=1489 /DNA_ORIENTATION=-
MASSVQFIGSQPWTDLFQVSPSQFNITCQLQKEEFLQLSIVSSCNDCIAWKLKTNRPGRYMVSPKQGIIRPQQRKDCTVVLSKLKEVPDTKKPDKFLIQATKVNPSTQDADLPQLWKDRESKHDKKRGVYAYQAVTIKCFLNIEEQKENDNARKPLNIIEDYVSSESTESPSKQMNIAPSLPSQPTKAKSNSSSNESSQPETKTEVEQSEAATSKAAAKAKVIESIANAEDGDNKKTTENETQSQSQSKSISGGSETAQYNSSTVEQWRRKAQEYDELFQFTRKTLAQRDELNGRWKAEQEKTRALQKLNRELKEEKKHILSDYNQYRNTVKDDNDDTINNAERNDNYNEDEEEKRETIEDKQTRDRIKREREKEESIREMDEIDRKAEKNSQSGYTISIVHIIITILLMYVSFSMGKRYGGIGGNDALSNDIQTEPIQSNDNIIPNNNDDSIDKGVDIDEEQNEIDNEKDKENDIVSDEIKQEV